MGPQREGRHDRAPRDPPEAAVPPAATADAPAPSAATVLALQRTVGNAAVARMIARTAPGPRRAPPRPARTGPKRETRTQHVEGVIWYEPGLYLRPGRSHSGHVGNKLKHGTKIWVVDRHTTGDKTWSKVIVSDPEKAPDSSGLEGYIAEHFVKTDLPCPGATIHRLEGGELVIDIARHYFSRKKTGINNLRYFVNVLAYVNKRPQPKDWQHVGFDGGDSIWIPSVQYAKSLKQVVDDGSITGGMWGKIKGAWGKAKRALGKVAGIVVGLPAFNYGVLKGVVLETKDLLVGAVGGIVSIVKSIVSGSLLDDALELYRRIVHLPLRRLLGGLWDNFKGDDKGIWERWSYRGEIVGRGVTMAVIAFFSGGSSLVASLGSRLAAFAARLRELRVVSKLSDAVSGGQRRKAERLLRRDRRKKNARKPYRACFVAGTLVDAGDGAIAIERLAVGDTLFGQHAGEPASAGRYAVLDAQRGHAHRLVVIRLGGDDVVCTNRHPFSVVGRGWVDARDVRAGDRLETRSGRSLTVSEVQSRPTPRVTTYSLIVETVSTFFVNVAGEAVLVHNGPPEGQDFDRELYWLLSHKPQLRADDLDGLSLWRTTSRKEVERFMQVRVDEMWRPLTERHAAYTPAEIRDMGLRPDPSPGRGALAKAGLRHFSLRPKSAAVFDRDKPSNKPPNELTPHQRALVVRAYERVRPGVRAKPKDLAC